MVKEKVGRYVSFQFHFLFRLSTNVRCSPLNFAKLYSDSENSSGEVVPFFGQPCFPHGLPRRLQHISGRLEQHFSDLRIIFLKDNHLCIILIRVSDIRQAFESKCESELEKRL